jgi:hypothetical protein
MQQTGQGWVSGMDWKTTYTANERLPGSWHVTIVSYCPETDVTIAEARDFDHEPKQEEVEKVAAEWQAEEEAKYQAFLDAKVDVKYEDWSPAPPVEVVPDKERVYIAVGAKGEDLGEFSTKDEAVAVCAVAVSAEVAKQVEEAKPVDVKPVADLGGLEVKP